MKINKKIYEIQTTITITATTLRPHSILCMDEMKIDCRHSAIQECRSKWKFGMQIYEASETKLQDCYQSILTNIQVSLPAQRTFFGYIKINWFIGLCFHVLNWIDFINGWLLIIRCFDVVVLLKVHCIAVKIIEITNRKRKREKKCSFYFKRNGKYAIF